MTPPDRPARAAPINRLWIVLFVVLVCLCSAAALVSGGYVGYAAAQAQITPAPTATLAPTPTPIPSDTPTPEGDPREYIAPTATIVASFDGLPEYMFKAGSALWLQVDDPASQVTVDDRALVIAIHEADTLRLVLAAFSGADVMVETVARTLNANPDDPHAYGLVFRSNSDGSSYYLFGIVPGRQEYTVTLTQGDAVAELRPPTFIPATAFRPGLREANRLGVLAIGSRFWFFVNGQLLDVIDDPTLPEGGIGVFVRSGATGDSVAVSFEQMTVRQP